MNRRRFLNGCSAFLTGLYALLLVVPGFAFLMDPLFRRKQARKTYRLAQLDDLQVGVPQKFVVTDQRVDAWTRYPEGPIGVVWLLRTGESEVTAYSATCPHLGCSVDFLDETQEFHCPCHQANYGMDGAVLSGPQQRGLDTLTVSLEKEQNQQWVSILFERFQLGSAEKVSLG